MIKSIFLAGLIATSAASIAQTTTYAGEAGFQFDGWRKEQGRDGSHAMYLAFQSGVNDAQGGTYDARYAVHVDRNAIQHKWIDVFEQEGNAPEAGYNKWLKNHASAGMGKTVFQFSGKYFVDQESTHPKVAPLSTLATSATFKAGGKSYSLKLANDTSGPAINGPEGIAAVRKAKFTLSLGTGSQNWVMQKDAGFTRDCSQYAIDRVITSPDGKYVAVFVAAYDYAFHEGWNIVIRHLVVTGTLANSITSAPRFTATEPVEKNQRFDSKLYIIVAGKVNYLMTAAGQWGILDKNHDLPGYPKAAVACANNWYAGGGEQMCVIRQGSNWVVKHRWQQESGAENNPPYGPWKTFATFNKAGTRIGK